MKKLISVLLIAVIFVLSFASCSGDKANDSNEPDTNKENISVDSDTNNSTEAEPENKGTATDNSADNSSEADSKKPTTPSDINSDKTSNKTPPESPADWTLYNLEEMGNMLISISEFNLTAPDPYVCFYGFGDAVPLAYIFNNETHGNIMALELDLSEADRYGFTSENYDDDSPVCFEIVDEFTYRFYSSGNSDDIFNMTQREKHYTHHISRYTVNDKSIVVFGLFNESSQNGVATTLPDSYLFPDHLGGGYYNYFIPSVFIDKEKAPEITYIENDPNSLEPDICVKMYLNK